MTQIKPAPEELKKYSLVPILGAEIKQFIESYQLLIEMDASDLVVECLVEAYQLNARILLAAVKRWEDESKSVE